MKIWKGNTVRVGGSIDIRPCFTQDMTRYCGKEFIVRNVYGNDVYITPYKHKTKADSWSWCHEMFELIEEGYTEKQKAKRESMKSIGVENKTELIEEMLKKVDKQKILRIFAGSFNISMKTLNGVDKLLKQWAEAKVDLYEILGRNLKVEKEIEYSVSGREIKKLVVEEIGNKFPIIGKYLTSINERSYANNTYDDELYFLKAYCPTLVSRYEVV